ncbi:MAG TPA: alpha-hydroxy-acid oxidizing protein [Pseudolabrys sp.]|jgi:isopentenyl diphosphate isomerase/L-lactate dehydrogenase-like FMN-dependent dehydrogenase|nr:alpha-hydroxy-acid oxidizing protein [Pseudolabrys sp.]
MDGILFSNHGGRGEDSGRSTIDALREIIGTVRPRAGESSKADFAAAPTWLT